MWPLFALVACTRAASPAPPAEATVTSVANTVVVDAAPGSAVAPGLTAPLPGTPVELGGRSKAGLYQAVVRFTVPKVSEMFALEARVSLANGAKLPEGTTVTVDATMPEHRHGMMTQPVTAAAGPGQWRADGLKLHMQGHWVFAVELRGPAGDDRLELPFEQPPEATAP